MAEQFISFTPVESKYKDYTTDTYTESVFTSIYSLLNTPIGSHPYDPNFGVNFKQLILELDTGNLSQAIELSVKNALKKYLPEIYPLVVVIVTRNNMPDGLGYSYTVSIIIQDAVINFGINKATGSVMFVGLSED